jgi:hypothetical protein
MLMLKDDRETGRGVVDLPRMERIEPFKGIRCPLCSWRPEPSSRWTCAWSGGPEPRFEACGAVWNTFITRGRCPGCSHEWQWTSCHRCEQWSRHEDWYEQ